MLKTIYDRIEYYTYLKSIKSLDNNKGLMNDFVTLKNNRRNIILINVFFSWPIIRNKWSMTFLYFFIDALSIFQISYSFWRETCID